MAKIAEVDLVDVMSRSKMYVELKREREMKLRVWVAVRLIALAAWVLRSKVEVSLVD